MDFIVMHDATKDSALVCIVDDDESVREALPDLLRTLGLRVLAFESAAEYLASGQIPSTDCLVTDVAMPDMTGPELYTELRGRGHRLPVIFITAHGGADVVARLEGLGAFACLLKPIVDTELLDAVRAALDAGFQGAASSSPFRPSA
jgi:FixJ family two-component response regulator